MPATAQDHGAEEEGVVVEAETLETAKTLAKRELEFEEVSVDANGRTIAVEITDIVCEAIDD